MVLAMAHAKVHAMGRPGIYDGSCGSAWVPVTDWMLKCAMEFWDGSCDGSEGKI